MLFFGRIVAAVVLGWFLGVAVAWPFMMQHESPGPLPALTIPVAVPVVYALSFLVVPRGGRR